MAAQLELQLVLVSSCSVYSEFWPALFGRERKRLLDTMVTLCQPLLVLLQDQVNILDLVRYAYTIPHLESNVTCNFFIFCPDSGLLKVQISSIPSNRSGSGGLGNSRSWFTYDELVEATDGFSDQKLLGKGGFGSVYKGDLQDGREVAVKLLKSGGGQQEREFRSEVEIISRVHHRHLVSLVGYCISGERRLLVFDYLPNDTLYFHLHGK